MNRKDLQIGNEYNNDQIMKIFGVANSGGIRPSNSTNTLVVFSFHYVDTKNRNPYEDKWMGSILHYTGQGLTGDQELIKNNKKLADSYGQRKVHLFETFTKTVHTYRGEVELRDQPYTVHEIDSEGNNRIVYKFPLTLINEDSMVEKTTVNKGYRKKEKFTAKIPFNELKRLAKEADKSNKELYKHSENTNILFRRVRTESFERNLYIAQYIKEIANGICGLCDQPAPFNDKSGKPFLHSHHVEYLSNGGKDVIENCIAVCPNCHARIHALEDPKDKKKLLNKISSRN